MRTLTAIIAYLGVAAPFVIGAGTGVQWLLTADAAPSAEGRPRIPNIPPRIADSIERKKAFTTPEEASPKQAAPAMLEAPVALTRAPQKVIIRELEYRASPQKRALRRSPMREVKELTMPAPTSLVRGRSDNPYD